MAEFLEPPCSKGSASGRAAYSKRESRSPEGRPAPPAHSWFACPRFARPRTQLHLPQGYASCTAKYAASCSGPYRFRVCSCRDNTLPSAHADHCRSVQLSAPRRQRPERPMGNSLSPKSGHLSASQKLMLVLRLVPSECKTARRARRRDDRESILSSRVSPVCRSLRTARWGEPSAS